MEHLHHHCHLPDVLGACGTGGHRERRPVAEEACMRILHLSEACLSTEAFATCALPINPEYILASVCHL